MLGGVGLVCLGVLVCSSSYWAVNKQYSSKKRTARKRETNARRQTSSSGVTADGLRFAILDVTRAMNPVDPAEIVSD